MTVSFEIELQSKQELSHVWPCSRVGSQSGLGKMSLTVVYSLKNGIWGT